MKVECNKCGKTLNIPDEKIPPNKKVNVSCPSCKNKITVEKPPANKKAAEPPAETTERAEKETAPEEQEEQVKVMDPSEFADEELEILAEDFAGASLKKNNVLKYIQPLPMTTRRKMFIALLGKDFRTMDNMQAFSLSVNVVINFKDMDNLTAILKKTISENDAFYKVFKETLVALGKV
tara:strand:+ start:296 stop:832 length:537 start_codon:yes stop_codon:yes gene_type:complete